MKLKNKSHTNKNLHFKNIFKIKFHHLIQNETIFSI